MTFAATVSMSVMKDRKISSEGSKLKKIKLEYRFLPHYVKICFSI